MVQGWDLRQCGRRCTTTRAQIDHPISSCSFQRSFQNRRHRRVEPETLYQPADVLYLHAPQPSREPALVFQFEKAHCTRNYFSAVCPSDQVVLAWLGGGTLLLAGGTEWLSRRGVWPQWLCRKVLHIGAIGACAAAPLLLEDLGALRLIVAISAALLVLLVGKGVLFQQAGGRRSWGIALFPLPYLAMLLCAPEGGWAIALPMALLALADAGAAIVGGLFPWRPFRATADAKTLSGSLAFASIAAGILVAAPGPVGVTQLVFTVAMLTLLESLGSHGLDNVYIPTASYLLLASAPPEHAHFPALLAAAVFVPACMRMGWLSLGGALTACVLGLWTFHFAGAWALLPLVLFLASSSVLDSLFRGHANASMDSKHGRPRDAVQVFCNGGPYMLAATFYPTLPALAGLAMAVGVATSWADTWASVVGTARGGTPWSLRTGKRGSIGASGHISPWGSAAALVGAVACAAVCVGSGLVAASHAKWVVLAAMCGMLLDGLLGAWAQAAYAHPNGQWSDTPAVTGAAQRGLAWFTNDGVNLASNAITICIACAIVYLNSA
jgi:uncharacterized membrane protein